MYFNLHLIDLQLYSFFKLNLSNIDIDKLIYSPEFSEVRETFRRAYHAKSGTDNRKPKTMKYLNTFLKNKKKNTYELDQHYKNLTSLQRRLADIGSVSLINKFVYSLVR